MSRIGANTRTWHWLPDVPLQVLCRSAAKREAKAKSPASGRWAARLITPITSVGPPFLQTGHLRDNLSPKYLQRPKLMHVWHIEDCVLNPDFS